MIAFLFFLSIHPAYTKKELTSGWLQGYYNYTQITNYFTQIVSTYPSISYQGILGTTYLGSQIPYLKLTKTGIPQSQKPSVVFSASLFSGHPIGSQSVIHTIDLILQSQQNLQSSISYFIPIINLDAWFQMQQQFKNNQNLSIRLKNFNNKDCNQTEKTGVNLNRNFWYNWGKDEIGSSSEGCNEYFRGRSAGSEQETKTIKDFISSVNPGLWLHFQKYGQYALIPTTSQEHSYEQALHFLGFPYENLYHKIEKKIDFNLKTAYQIDQKPKDGTLIDYLYSQGFFPVQVALGKNKNEKDELDQIVYQVQDLVRFMYDSVSFSVQIQGCYVEEDQCGNLYHCIEEAFSYLIFDCKLENSSPLSSQMMTFNFDLQIPENNTEYDFFLGSVHLYSYMEKQEQYSQWEEVAQLDQISTSSISQNNTLSMTGQYSVGAYTRNHIYILIQRTKIQGASSVIQLLYTFESFPTSVQSDPSNLTIKHKNIVEVSNKVEKQDELSPWEGKHGGYLIGGLISCTIILLIAIGIVVFYIRYKTKKYKTKQKKHLDRSMEPCNIGDSNMKYMPEASSRV